MSAFADIIFSAGAIAAGVGWFVICTMIVLFICLRKFMKRKIRSRSKKSNPNSKGVTLMKNELRQNQIVINVEPSTPRSVKKSVKREILLEKEVEEERAGGGKEKRRPLSVCSPQVIEEEMEALVNSCIQIEKSSLAIADVIGDVRFIQVSNQEIRFEDSAQPLVVKSLHNKLRQSKVIINVGTAALRVVEKEVNVENLKEEEADATVRKEEPRQSLVCPPQVSETVMEILVHNCVLIDKSCLAIGDVVGKGRFSQVSKGELRQGDTVRQVAVKTVHNTGSLGMICADLYLEEALMMMKFNHEHVLTMIGVSFEDTGWPMIVLPFMEHGDLKTYVEDERRELTVEILMSFAAQVAEGMTYLAENKYVHRDLAARNCMIDEDLVVKVADFGLSRDIYEKDYYKSNDNQIVLPYRWMAPEAFEGGKFTTQSDVWSFGVVLWELFTRGDHPYDHISNWDVLTYLKAGNRLTQPPYCPEYIYAIMKSCWALDPTERPAFSELAVNVKDACRIMRRERSRKLATYENVISVQGTPVHPQHHKSDCTLTELGRS